MEQVSHSAGHLLSNLLKALIQGRWRDWLDAFLDGEPSHGTDIYSDDLTAEPQCLYECGATSHKGVQYDSAAEIGFFVVVSPRVFTRREESSQQDSTKDRAQSPCPPLMYVINWSVDVRPVALHRGQFIDLVNREALLDVEFGSDLIHFSSFCPAVGPGIPTSSPSVVQVQEHLALVRPQQFKFEVGQTYAPVKAGRRPQWEVGAAIC